MSPLHQLLGALPTRLEQSRPSALTVYDGAYATGRVTGRIAVTGDLPLVDDVLRRPCGPAATVDGDLILPLDFAERLWAVTLGLLVLADAEQASALAALGRPVEDCPPPAVVATARALLDAALDGPLRPWPDGAPTPDDAARHAPTSHHLAWWVGRANGVYLDALTYIAAHEAAHLVQRHAPALRGALTVLADAAAAAQAARAAGGAPRAASPAEAEARQVALEAEREADADAREALLGAGVPDDAQLPRGLAAVAACAASLLLAGSVRALRQTAHPDLDTRLRQTLEALDPGRAGGTVADPGAPDSREALWCWAATTIRVALARWGRPVDVSSGFETWADFASVLFDLLERAKADDCEASPGTPAVRGGGT